MFLAGDTHLQLYPLKVLHVTLGALRPPAPPGCALGGDRPLLVPFTSPSRPLLVFLPSSSRLYSATSRPSGNTVSRAGAALLFCHFFLPEIWTSQRVSIPRTPDSRSP